MYGLAAVTLHAIVAIVLSLKSGGKDKQHLPFGHAADSTQIQHAVRRIRTGAEVEAAALVTVGHAGDKHQAGEADAFRRRAVFIYNQLSAVPS